MLKHVTVFLPAPYRGGTLRVTKSIAKMLQRGSQQDGRPCKVRVGVRSDTYDMDEDFRDLYEAGIEVRIVDWEMVPPEQVKNANFLQGREVDLPFDQYQMPRDGINSCIDSDLWLFVSDRVDRPVAPVRPLVVFATDYIQRYVPDIIRPDVRSYVDIPFLQMVRQANAVLVTTPQTGADAVSYAGLPANKVHLAPMDFDPTHLSNVDRASIKEKKPYFVWPTNTAQHKNHLRAFEALRIYYGELGGQLNVKITGPNTPWFNPENEIDPAILAIPYVRQVRNQFQRSSELHDRVEFAGELPDHGYAKALAGAKFLWHATLIDNGTFVVAEAAYLGCPSLVSDYPQMRYISERFSVPMGFFNAHSARAMAIALKGMEKEAADYRQRLPSRKALEKFSWESYALEYWRMLQRVA